jgi:hypothetical protein
MVKCNDCKHNVGRIDVRWDVGNKGIGVSDTYRCSYFHKQMKMNEMPIERHF